MNDLQRGMSTETTLRILADPQRRQILRRLADTPDGTTVDQLEQQLQVADPTSPAGNGSRHPGIELHHVHLPKLQETDVIEYDASRGAVRRGRQFKSVNSLLEVIDDHRGETSTPRS